MDFVTLQHLVWMFVALPIVYGLGWAWSKGYHRAKRAFVDRMVKDHCNQCDKEN